MNCKNCGYGLKQSCGDFEKIICTYEEGECVKITELENENRQLRNEVQDLTAYCNQIGKIKTGVLKLFEHIVAK
jgi:hypothetical protein